MRRRLFKGAVLVGAIALVACASAYALKIEIDKTVVSATASISPRALPAKGNAPVNIEQRDPHQDHRRLGAADPEGTRLQVRQARLGRHQGPAGLQLAKLAETTTAAARKRCPGAIVGEGVGRAEVNLPGQAPVAVSSPLTFFNAPPDGGKPALIAHAYETVPAAKTILAPISIERISHGRYGYRVEIAVPEIAGGFGAATLAKATVGNDLETRRQDRRLRQRPLQRQAAPGPRHPHLHRRRLLPRHPRLTMHVAPAEASSLRSIGALMALFRRQQRRRRLGHGRRPGPACRRQLPTAGAALQPLRPDRVPGIFRNRRQGRR